MKEKSYLFFKNVICVFAIVAMVSLNISNN